MKYICVYQCKQKMIIVHFDIFVPKPVSTIVMMGSLIEVAVSQYLLLILSWIFTTFVIRKRCIHSKEGSRAFSMAANQLKQAARSGLATSTGSTVLFKNRTIPVFTIFWGQIPATLQQNNASNGSSTWFYRFLWASAFYRIVYASVVVAASDWIGMYSDLNVTLTIYAWAWSENPIILSSTSTDSDENMIKVLEATSNEVRDASYLNENCQIAVHRSIPEAVKLCSENIASAIIDKFKMGNHDSMVCILMGKPGVGKSTVARVLTKQLNGVLYPAYNPTRVGQCLKAVTNECKASEGDVPLVIVMEEFDVALRNIMNGNVHGTDDIELDAKDKSSWNLLLDDIHVTKHVVMILTTNCTWPELQLLCKNDTSLLRQGRVDCTYVVEPSDVASYPASALECSEGDTSEVDSSVADILPMAVNFAVVDSSALKEHMD